jgi:hypothetical protein
VIGGGPALMWSVLHVPQQAAAVSPPRRIRALLIRAV